MITLNICFIIDTKDFISRLFIEYVIKIIIIIIITTDGYELYLCYVRGEQLDKPCFSDSHLIRYWKMYNYVHMQCLCILCIFWETKHLNLNLNLKSTFICYKLSKLPCFHCIIYRWTCNIKHQLSVIVIFQWCWDCKIINNIHLVFHTYFDKSIFRWTSSNTKFLLR